MSSPPCRPKRSGGLKRTNVRTRIERGYLGKKTYNDTANWAYADLPKVFRRDTSAGSSVVKTVRDLQNALSAPNDTMIFAESIMCDFGSF
jgi:TPP-dependent 2-oxoacid decarboxylase